ncbi:MAG TPA: thioredoxin reductase [Coriobacteriia bacterium]|nr:thioredoxin reductase [Coriobacteriia bacterium]
MYDIAIVGAGPAGLSAAIWARSRNKEVLVISNKPEESRLAKAKHIANYAGMPEISGLAMLKTMVKQAEDLEVSFIYDRVTSITSTGEYFMLSAGQDAYQARAVILAPGTNNAKPFSGENDYLGRGVSHCATCDGMFYKNASVTVVGLNNEAPKEANFLKDIGAKVTYLSPKPTLGLDDDIEAITGSAVEVKGDKLGVTELVYKHAETGELETVYCAGVFILRPQIAPDTLIAGLEVQDGHIVVDEKMQTNITGVFAAGDCLGEPLQVAKAVGEGQVACYHAIEYLG